MTLKEAQQEVDSWIKKYGVRYFSELTNMAVLTEEVGELARVMARKYGDRLLRKERKTTLKKKSRTSFGYFSALPTRPV